MRGGREIVNVGSFGKVLVVKFGNDGWGNKKFVELFIRLLYGRWIGGNGVWSDFFSDDGLEMMEGDCVGDLCCLFELYFM